MLSYKLEILTKDHQGIGIVSLVGEIDASTAPILETELLPFAGRHHKLIVDLAGVRAITSVGLRKILMLYRTIKFHNGQILICGMNESLRNIFWAAGFLNYFIVAESLEMGIAAFE